MTPTETTTTALLSRLPELQEGKMPPVEPKLTDELVQAVLGGGQEAIVGLIDALREVDNGSDWKVRFMLQALVIAVGTAAQAPHKRKLAEIMLDEAAGIRPAPIRTFLLARLRLLAGCDELPRLIALLTAEDPQLSDAAATVLVSIGTPSKEPLAEALKAAQGLRKDAIQNALAQIR